ncbi:MAG: TonB-dependent receptor [Gammaproteobacteria bacterium]
MKLKTYLAGAATVVGGFGLLSTQQAVAQQSASAQAMLEEVVVTARRREESLQDLPLSIAAITADAMQAQGIYDIMDISDHVPNVNFTNTGRRGVTAIFIRGIGNNSPGNLQPVGAGVYIDGHYLPNTVGQMLNTVDVERIEVLRGPQGTLFGKNTTGGAINIISAKPGPEFEADALLRVADFGQQDFRGMLNVPISDTVSSRFAFADESSDGYYFNRFLNEDRGATDLQAFSAQLRFTPNDNWMIDLSFRGNYQDDHNATGRCVARPTQGQVDNLANDVQIPGIDHPAAIYTGPVFADGIGQWGGSARADDGTRHNIGGHVERLYSGAVIDLWEACQADEAAGDYVFSSERRSILELDNENINATIQWDSNGEVGPLDNLNVKVIASTHETDYNYFQDRDFSPIPIDAIGTAPFPGRGQTRTTDNFEILFTGIVSDRVDFVVGAHFFDDLSETGGGNCLNTTRANFAALSDPNSGFSIPCAADGGTQFDWLSSPRATPGGPYPAGMSGRVTNESQAIFGHVTIDLSDNWTLDLGARYTDEDRFFNLVEVQTVPETCSFGQPGDPARDTFCTPDYVLSYGSVFEDGFYNDTFANFSETTPMVSLTRNFEDGMLYFLYSEGFLSGSFNDELNVTLVPELAPLLTYEPEHLNNFEIGYKGTFLNGRVTIAGDIFYMDYQDKQEQINIDNTDGQFGGDPAINITTNAATVDITGIELEVRASLWDGGFLAVDIGHLDAEYGAFSSFDPNNVGEFIDQSALTIADFSPEWTLNATVEHQFNLSNGATLTPQLGVYYADDYDFAGGLDSTVGERSRCFTPAYAKFRARVTYAPAEANWQAALFGSNINDERYNEWCQANGRSGTYYQRFGRPDTWGLEFNYRWGT